MHQGSFQPPVLMFHQLLKPIMETYTINSRVHRTKLVRLITRKIHRMGALK